METYNEELVENLSNGIWYIKRDSDTFDANLLASKLDELPTAMNRAKFEKYRPMIHNQIDKLLLLNKSKIKSGTIMKIILDTIGK